jgi:TPR repeat protein
LRVVCKNVLGIIIHLSLCLVFSGYSQEYFDGCEIRYKLADGMETLISSANQGEPEAQYCLAIAFHDGKRVERDIVQAVAWYEKAGQKGHVEAQYWLCLMHRDGIGVQKNRLESLYWCERAAKTEHPRALYELGQWYYVGIDRNTHFLVKAYIWFSRALVAGELAAEDMLRLLESQMTSLQIQEAKKLSAYESH